MKFLTLFSCFVAGSAWASTPRYDLKMQLSMNGKAVASPRVKVVAGETMVVLQEAGSEQYFIEVVASEATASMPHAIQMKFVVGRIDNNGDRLVEATPQVIVRENQSARVEMSDKKPGNKKIAISVTAKRF